MPGKVTSTKGEGGGNIGTIDIVGFGKGTIVRHMGKMEQKQNIGLVVASLCTAVYDGPGSGNFKTVSIQNSVQGGRKCFGNLRKLKKGR